MKLVNKHAFLHAQYKAGWRIYKTDDVFTTPPTDKELEILCNRLSIQAVVFDELGLLFVKTIHHA